MISHTWNFIFVHIPKTGGTSISSVLKPHGTVLSGESNHHSMYYKHATAQYMKTVLGDTFEDYLSFSVVRNPYDWLVSNYEFNRGFHQPFLMSSNIKNSREIPAWLRDIPFSAWLPWWLQSFSPSQRMFITAADGRLLVDEIINFENIDCGFARVCAKLGIEQELLPLPHFRRSERLSTEHYYRDATHLVELVNSHLDGDFALGGYSKQLG